MLFLFNIKAGTSGVRSRAADIIDIFTKGGYDVLAHPSQSASDMEDIVRERGEEFDVVVTCGGDGSLNDTINGLMALDDPPAYVDIKSRPSSEPQYDGGRQRYRSR